ncbi:translocation/assembly module TamB domain-containing protein [Lysobacter silvisoli]|uniref:Translocation/assembly module TamB n=1 Tax=Lysobacter silvisoli TaxID=2293254 RepID=A0A371JXY5_9GAMM|nr:translocation/assembly module TamB domain-containing protein [Lysobacter silvisoli]RDZ26467.1 translocation/assembly module TamB [Lysobacter silvisoli]
MSDTPKTAAELLAERRQRRRAAARRWAWRSSALAGALTLLIAFALYWLLATVGGRNVLLNQIVARLPEGAVFTWRDADGPASGPLTLRGVHFAYEGIDFRAERVYLDTAIRPLLGRKLRLDALQVEDATLELPKSDEPFELPSWPDVLPDIAPPLSLQADDVRVDRMKISQAGEHLIDIRRLRGGLDAQTGKLKVERLGIDSDRGRIGLHGEYAPRDDYRTDLVATAVLPAPAGRTPPRLGLVAKGDLSRMDVALAGYAPGRVRTTLVLRGKDDPRWQLRGRADALDLGLLLTPGAPPSETPMTAQFEMHGVGGAAELSGLFEQGDLRAQILPSKLRLEKQVLDVQPLALHLFDGTATLRGQADFTDPGNGRFKFAVNARGLRWGGAAPAPTAKTPVPVGATPAIVADADLGFAGTVKAWAAIGNARIERDRQAAIVRFDGRGDDQRMNLKTLQVQMPTGRLDGQGDVAWAPKLGWNFDATLAGFDPGYFAPDWKGAVNGKLFTRGDTRTDGGLEIAVDASQLGGRLRDRPLQGRGRFLMHGAATGQSNDAYEGDVALTLGGSRIDAKGKLAQTLDVDAKFAPLQLADLLPGTAGSVRGTLKLSGARDAPNVDADLTGSGLKYGDYSAQTLVAKGRLPWRGRGGALELRATGLDAGLPMDTIALDARGAVEALQLQGEARGEIGTLALSGHADKRGATWQGALATLQLTPSKGASWRLQQAAQFRWDGNNGALSNACLASSGGGSLCASADWPRRGLDVKGQGLPLTLAQPYLPARADGRPWLLRGDITVDGQLRPVGNAWRGQATVTSASGGLRFSERSRREPVRYGNLSLRAEFDPRRIDAELGAVLNDDGRVDARIATGWDAYSPLDGEVAINTDELTWVELFSPDIVEPKGKLDGRIGLSGTRDAPRLSGQARLSEFSTELPALAIALQDGDVRLDAQADGSARIAGSVRSGEGTLNIDGTLGWQGEDTPLVLNLRGKNVLMSDTRDLHAVADPELTVRYAARQPLQVTGKVGVPKARIDLERLDQGVSASPDVVVLDPEDPERTASAPLDLDLTLALGEDVKLNGFGLDGSLEGQMRVRARPGREMTASGRLDVSGRYRAYGQKLQITRGHLAWSNGPVSDPILDVRAEREVGEVTAGVDISGRASAPQVNVWSNPASSQSEALAYLALGRPLSSVSGDESRQLNAANAALSAGGSLLASQLGAKIGLDDAGVMESRALGGSVLGVGKYLSPRLYVGYGVSLLGTGQVLTLKYLLRKGFDIEIESSTLENRASINWRKEK